ncbi:MAG TPA: class I SAM-dependent methyltransferase [Acidimicrobiales bacterium]|nr:class I SAM-dependent methyltransferase [Acidimicrobiales bacterium]
MVPPARSGPKGTSTAAARWSRLVKDRLAEAERLRAGAGATGGDYWNKSRARRFSDRVTTAQTDPFLRRLRKVTGAKTTVLDVGAGAGRFSIALAPRAEAVTAVDPSEAMIRILRRRAKEAGASNITAVLGRWEDVEVAPADVAFSAHVLPLVPDAATFLRKLDSAARRHAFLYTGAYWSDAIFDPFWRHFHGAPRKPGATWVDAVAVLEELGIQPQVEVVELPYRARFRTVEEATADYAEQLLVPDTKEARAELKHLLESWLIRRGDRFGPPIGTMPAAIMHWSGDSSTPA